MWFGKLTRGGTLAVALLAIAAICGQALAGITDFLGSWVNSETKTSGFLGDWLSSDSEASGIARIVVTPAGPTHVRIHLYGRCQPNICDWGERVGRNHSGDPDSDEVRSISADFDVGFAHKLLTLRKGPAGSLHFDVVTDFTDRSGRHDFEISGSFARAPEGPPVVSAPVVAAQPPPPAAGETVAPTGGPATAAVAAPPASAPVSSAAGASVLVEDCVAINPADIHVAPSDRVWKVNDFDHTILNFGANKVAAVTAARVLEYYRFDEQCYITRPRAKMIYWRTAGELPRDSMPGQDCIEVHPANAKAIQAGDGWKVVDGDIVLVDFGEDQASAEQAASVIRTYHLSRQCFVARPDTTMTYWLTQ